MHLSDRFGVIVVGGGHAGTEAALASARMGVPTLLLTHSIETLGQMSCNPSIGGIGKGHLVREVDALGGAMAIATDEAGIQFRTLNASKGPAVRATRAQADRILYRAAIRRRLENQPNLTLFQQAVDDLIVEGDRVAGVVTQIGLALPRRRGRADHRHVPLGAHPRRPAELRGRPRGRPAGEAARRRAARAQAPGRAPEDGHAAATRRSHDRLRSPRRPAGRRSRARVLVHGHARDAPGAAALLDHAHDGGDARDHPRRARPLAALRGRDPGRGPALLPVDRGQGRALRRARVAPGIPRARGPDDERDLSERRIDVAAVRRAECDGALDAGLRARAHPASRLRDRVRLRRPARAARDARDQGRRTDSTSPDRSTGRPATRRRRRRGCSRARTRRSVRAARRAGARAATRRTWACSSTT